MTRRKKDFSPHVDEQEAKACSVGGCPEPGLYKAPISRDALNDYRYFCLEHIREHNKRWDYFSGMSAEEIEAFVKDAVTGHRPTWERGQTIPGATEKLYAAVNDFLGEGMRRKTKAMPGLGGKISKALGIFEMEHPFTEATLRRRYKLLVKQCHPDKNRGDKLAEEKFKAVADAYRALSEYLKKQE